MKRLFFILGFLVVSSQLFSQDTEEEPLDHLFKVELGFQGVGLAYELPLSDRWSIDFSSGLGGGYYITNQAGINIQYTWIINDPVIYVKSEAKYHYNRPKRLRKGKSLRNNASNYLAFQTKYTTERVFSSSIASQIEDPLNNTLLNEIHWGIQRPVGQRFLFNLHLGLGVATDYDFNNTSAYPGFGLKFSYILVKK